MWLLTAASQVHKCITARAVAYTFSHSHGPADWKPQSHQFKMLLAPIQHLPIRRLPTMTGTCQRHSLGCRLHSLNNTLTAELPPEAFMPPVSCATRAAGCATRAAALTLINCTIRGHMLVASKHPARCLSSPHSQCCICSDPVQMHPLPWHVQAQRASCPSRAPQPHPCSHRLADVCQHSAVN